MSFFKNLREKVLFSDWTAVLRLGATRPLQAEDLPQLPRALNPRQQTLNEDKIDWSSGAKLLASMMAVTRPYFLLSLSLYAVFAVMNLLGPLTVQAFVVRLETGLTDSQIATESFALAVAVGLVGVIGGLALQHYFRRHLHLHQILINVINRKLFLHALSLHKEAREKIPVGDIVNHMSSDTDYFSEIWNGIADLLYCAVMILGSLALLFHFVGSTAWVAVGLLAILFPITRKVASDFAKYDKELMHWRDERVTLMAQILNAIRIIKSFVWEKSVTSEVNAVRSRELAARRRLARSELVVTVLYVSVGTLVLFAVLAVHVWRGGTLSPSLLFACVSLFALLEDPFSFISRGVSQFIAGRVAADRIAKFLNEPLVPDHRSALDAVMPSEVPVGVELVHLSIKAGEKQYQALTDVSLKIDPGTSLAIIGPVGAGKTTLLHALLGEVMSQSGTITYKNVNGQTVVNPRIGFVPQEAFILNASLRSNLTFEQNHLSQAEIEEAIQLAALAQDLAGIQGGLNAEIGEKGINLSGGQRQRLSLARAILHRPQIVLLDDPLSAVDPNTEHELRQNLLFGKWKTKTRIVVTHRLSELQDFDRIAFLEEGRLVSFGSFDQLMQSCSRFRSYLDECETSQTHASKEVKVSVAKEGEGLRVTDDEDREQGAVRSQTFISYILALGGKNPRWRSAVLVALFLAAGSHTALPMIQRLWLAWAPSFNLSALDSIYIYGWIGLIATCGLLLANMFWLQRGLAAGRDIHDKMLASTLGSRIRFFDATPAGRILQRFSRDVEAVDIHLQWSFDHSMRSFTQVSLTLLMIVVTLPWMLVPLVPVALVYYHYQKIYRSSAREVKRLDSIARSPRYAHFKETVSGLVVIRAFAQRSWFLEGFYRRLEHSQRMFYGHYMINRWFSTRIPIVGGCVAMATAVLTVMAVQQGALAPGMAGLLIVYSLSFWGALNWGIRMWSEVEARMTSMERIQAYSDLAQEESGRGSEATGVWPSQGEIRFANVFARYADHLPHVLRGVSFTVQGGSRVGIVGRTGSGKSTIFQTLYRFVDLTAGQIFIDDVDIATVPLAQLRRALAIIPQDPTLFVGTLRQNLDRYDEHTDAKIWEMLDRTSMGNFVRQLPGELSYKLVENGANLSQGQRQLLCLARALLMEAKVIVLDEATASVDVQTDATVQRVLRECGKGVTMLIIAHRLGTVRDCDQIIELEAGEIVKTRARRNPATSLARSAQPV